MVHESLHDEGAPLQVIQGFEKRGHRQWTDQLTFDLPQDASLTTEHIKDEKVGDLACHADDEETQAFGTMPIQVVGNDRETANRHCRFLWQLSARGSQWAQTGELLIEKSLPLQFVHITKLFGFWATSGP